MAKAKAARPAARAARSTGKTKLAAPPGGRRSVEPAPDPATLLRAICLSLPEVSEKEAWGTPTFRVRGKMFAMYVDDHHGDGRRALWCKAPLGIQEMLVDADARRFFVPPYVGPKGWIGVRLDLAGTDWSEISDIVRDGYRAVAPARLVADLAPSGEAG
jgi:hypothetical protein